MKVVFTNNNFSLILRNTLFLIAPFSSEFNRCFHCLCPCVHRQHHVKTKLHCSHLCKLTKLVIIKSARCQGKLLRLIGKGINDFWIRMSLVNGRVCRKEIDIFFSFNIPYINSFTTIQHNWQGVVVVSTITMFVIDIIFSMCKCLKIHNVRFKLWYVKLLQYKKLKLTIRINLQSH